MGLGHRWALVVDAECGCCGRVPVARRHDTCAVCSAHAADAAWALCGYCGEWVKDGARRERLVLCRGCAELVRCPQCAVYLVDRRQAALGCLRCRGRRRRLERDAVRVDDAEQLVIVDGRYLRLAELWAELAMLRAIAKDRRARRRRRREPAPPKGRRRGAVGA